MLKFNGAPGAIRTHGLWLRRPTLYPTELRAHKICLDMPTRPRCQAACVRGFRDSAQAPSVGTHARWMGQKNGRSRKATHVQAGEGAKQSWAARRCLHGASLSGMHEQGDWRASPAALVVITENHHVRHSFTAMRNNTMRNNTMRNNTMRTCGGKPASPHGGGTDARSFCA